MKYRTCKTRVAEETSTRVHLEAGVPQGSVLSPTLYSLYTADIPRNPHTYLGLYADDTAIAARSTKPNLSLRYTQRHLEDLEEWMERWKIKSNQNKTKAVFFSKRRHRPDTQILHNETDIPWTDEAKYLGVTLDRKLTWNSHTTKITNTANNRYQALLPLLNRRSKLNPHTKARIYKSIILPTLTYSPSTWCFAATTHLNKLQTTQNKILRRITGAPWYVRTAAIERDLKVNPIKETIKQNALSTYRKAMTHQNPLLKSAVNYDTNEVIIHKRPRLGMT